jgi:hypothetical protein
MKTLRLSDEDYERLLRVLEAAIENAKDVSELGDVGWAVREQARRDAREAERLHDLLKPIEYDEPHTLADEKWEALHEGLRLLKLADVPVTLINGEQKVEL